MAHTYDTKNRNSGAGNPVQVAITPTAGATLLVVGIVTEGIIQRTGAVPSFDGVNLTQVGTVETALETNVEMWYLADPSIGLNNVVVPNTGAKNLFIVVSVYKAQAGHSSVLDVTDQDNDVNFTPSVSVTTTVDGDAIVDVMGDGFLGLPNTHNQTLLYSTDNGSFTDNHQYALQANFGAITFQWTTHEINDDWAMIVGAFKEVAAVTGHPWFYERKQ